ncbi:glycerol-3-phosphate 1-O-acyltransferase PlsY [Sphingosinicella rhizophila]|uniref:Glycerol-3-phosphate acyltransferase n=1 Tax=Sphingosinicella rhizophila TaxID=3050082 RepID=A0ABU3Q9D8_9SPHN|nr:glycerol-3-phosphate 1-O-acyltransferase PlsY [Sphingosinicella sp. GR2756]MDT9600007.1 glycerol-3-phosphate 1-O-acyltransferase PlsY [Sphingosinicella sp. GR2756]
MDLELIAAPLLAFLAGYALGAIPFGVLLTRLTGAGDLRTIGSGNIGATNVLRTGRKGLAAATLLLDIVKGTAALAVASLLFPEHISFAAFGAFIGHLYPVWLKFAGGKGVATYFGLILGYCILGALHWWVAAIYAGLWVGTLALTRYSSVAGMTAALLSPAAAAVSGRFDLALLFLGFGLILFWKHRANLERLLAGTEPQVGGRKDG